MVRLIYGKTSEKRQENPQIRRVVGIKPRVIFSVALIKYYEQKELKEETAYFWLIYLEN